ncbi:hypothetical protein N7541_006794 [Penicillium brevicompactum]|uniref:Uncharacterized protein n=1 Tax=Penicillium brevicompactum TaxID=5074 RepID=A0A9W9R5W3_PENBR|nr:hypothetical protein N7541_006794 [Penicillium brevicompactum]
MQIITTKTLGEKPSSAINDIDGGSGDINNGLGGGMWIVDNFAITISYVWLCPIWTEVKSDAISEIRLRIQSDADSDFQDLAYGAGGDYRYLIPLRDDEQKISSISLVRRKDSFDSGDIRQLGYNGWTEDINKDRGGAYLRLVWTLEWKGLVLIANFLDCCHRDMSCE